MRATIRFFVGGWLLATVTSFSPLATTTKTAVVRPSRLSSYTHIHHRVLCATSTDGEDDERSENTSLYEKLPSKKPFTFGILTSG